MSEHRWGEPDKDGVRACLRGGCTVRLSQTGRSWQPKARGHWKASSCLPACTGTDAQEAQPAFTPLSAPRFRWRTETTQPPAIVERYAAERHGQAFRCIRIECRLRLGDVARGWGVPVVEVSELERGLRRFASPADLWAATQQVWCWGFERNRTALLDEAGRALGIQALAEALVADAPESIGIPVVREPDDMPGGHWREACCFCVTRTPYWTAIPERTPGEQVACCQSCAATHKPEEVPTKSEWFKDTRKVRNSDAPEATPSPLEVVRDELAQVAEQIALRGLDHTASRMRAAIATLEASIRADEREACAQVAQEMADSWRDAIQHATDDAMRETATWAERACMDVTHNIRARGKR